MARRRAVRVIGSSLVALAVPGVAPRVARGAAAAGCPRDKNMCPRIVNLGTGPPLPCGPPARRYGCPNPSDKAGNCVDLCPPTKGIPCNSSKKDEGGCSYFTCCDRRLYADCKNEKCVECEDNEKLCFPADRGKGKCCKRERGEKCCFNSTSVACCGPEQTCSAANPRQPATCRCKPGTGSKCGSDCCGAGERCCDGEKCCKTGEECCGGECCTANESCCGGKTCCATGETCCGGLACCGRNEWCLHKRTGTIFNVPTCKPSCAPGNRAGAHCCGTGYEPNAARTRCVPA